MATDVLTVKVEFDKENAINCIKNVLMEEYGMALDELARLVKAKQEGRLVELPCKVGDPVWKIYDDCGFPGDCGTKQKCNGCEYRNVFVEEQAFCLSMLSQNGKLEHPYYTSIQSAEEKLKEVQNDG